MPIKLYITDLSLLTWNAIFWSSFDHDFMLNQRQIKLCLLLLTPNDITMFKWLPKAVYLLEYITRVFIYKGVCMKRSNQLHKQAINWPVTLDAWTLLVLKPEDCGKKKLNTTVPCITSPDSKVHGANMGPIWGRQDPGGPHVGPLKLCYLGGNQLPRYWQYQMVWSYSFTWKDPNYLFHVLYTSRGDHLYGIIVTTQINHICLY